MAARRGAAHAKTSCGGGRCAADWLPCLASEGVYAQYGALRYASNRYVGSILRLILPADTTGNRNQRVSDKACGVKENRHESGLRAGQSGGSEGTVADARDACGESYILVILY